MVATFPEGVARELPIAETGDSLTLPQAETMDDTFPEGGFSSLLWQTLEKEIIADMQAHHIPEYALRRG